MFTYMHEAAPSGLRATGYAYVQIREVERDGVYAAGQSYK